MCHYSESPKHTVVLFCPSLWKSPNRLHFIYNFLFWFFNTFVTQLFSFGVWCMLPGRVYIKAFVALSNLRKCSTHSEIRFSALYQKCKLLVCNAFCARHCLFWAESIFEAVQWSVFTMFVFHMFFFKGCNKK